ncbi:sugar phosphate isomerase/epimerase [Variovorax atrisoli]|uniref:sugar phosphate isomerase/epimerase family protein n=1 Tax=Variovorax atrisoli TaxID=3394203 RepID=UPI000F7F7FDE|nr:TIM barrel protein [Variovorax sp. 369]RTD85412.1 sugar phosphate isomerase/epimerase [Variovorax sp. 369]
MKFRLSLAHLGMLDAPPPLLVEAAHAAGLRGVGIRLQPARPGEAPFPMEEGGPMLRETLARVRDLGMTVHDIEIVRIRPGFDVQALSGVLASAQRLGARRLMVNVDDPDLVRAADNIGALAARAQSHGLVLGLEFMIYTAARSLHVARELAVASGSPAVRVLVDALHFFRAGSAPDEMAGPHVDRDFMQVNDALARRHPGLSPAEEGRAHRLFPGEGELPVHRLLAQLNDDAILSIEAPSAIRMATLDVHARAAAAYRATRDFLKANDHDHE